MSRRRVTSSLTRMYTQTRSTPEFIITSCLAHLCFLVTPLVSGPPLTATYLTATFALAFWLIGAKLRSHLFLICATPTAWVSTLRWWREELLEERLNPELAINLNDDILLTLGDVIPTLELSIGVIALGLYIAFALMWLHESGYEIQRLSPRAQGSDLYLLRRLAISERFNALSLEVKLFAYWCVVTPIALIIWGAQLPIPEALETYRDLYESLARLWFICLISIAIGVSFVLLRLTPPALLYLVTRDQYQLSRAWRKRAWSLLVLGAFCVALSL